jgi:hypothetical protein
VTLTLTDLGQSLENKPRLSEFEKKIQSGDVTELDIIEFEESVMNREFGNFARTLAECEIALSLQYSDEIAELWHASMSGLVRLQLERESMQALKIAVQSKQKNARSQAHSDMLAEHARLAMDRKQKYLDDKDRRRAQAETFRAKRAAANETPEVIIERQTSSTIRSNWLLRLPANAR